tara:strand:- start:421 stop:570 length:150 start_codon:yes stop_codon:yes gene_type:complete
LWQKDQNKPKGQNADICPNVNHFDIKKRGYFFDHKNIYYITSFNDSYKK